MALPRPISPSKQEDTLVIQSHGHLTIARARGVAGRDGFVPHPQVEGEGVDIIGRLPIVAMGLAQVRSVLMECLWVAFTGYSTGVVRIVVLTVGKATEEEELMVEEEAAVTGERGWGREVVRSAIKNVIVVDGGFHPLQ